MEIGVVGAGIVGLAVARALTHAAPGSRVTVFEKESEPGRHQTGHNSGVVHAGLYYRPGSLKAQLCSRGRGMMREYCAERGIPFVETGKLVVATTNDEVPRLREIQRRSTANGVPDLAWMSASAMTDIEPHVRGAAALHSPHTAVVDFHQVARAVAGDVAAAGGHVLCCAQVRGIRRIRGRIGVLTESTEGVPGDTSGGGSGCASGGGLGCAGGGSGCASGGDVRIRLFDRLVICAGLQSDRMAVAAGFDDGCRIVPFLGMYYRLVPSRRDLVRGLIYPVPDPRFPFLGVHLTRTVHDEVLVGPNAVLGLARETYRATGVSARDIAATLGWPGFYRLAARYWRSGLSELIGAASRRRFVSAASRYVPELSGADIERAPLGVRAQAVARDGSLVEDFQVSAGSGIVALRNAPSPAATSSFAIAEYLVPKVLATP